RVREVDAAGEADGMHSGWNPARPVERSGFNICCKQALWQTFDSRLRRSPGMTKVRWLEEVNQAIEHSSNEQKAPGPAGPGALVFRSSRFLTEGRGVPERPRGCRPGSFRRRRPCRCRLQDIRVPWLRP